MCSYCFAETPLRYPYVSQDKGAGNHEIDIACLLHTIYPVGHGLVGCLQVSVRPVCEPQEHVCLGAHLARMELQELFSALARRMRAAEITGAVERSASSFIGGVKRLPVRMTIEAAD